MIARMEPMKCRCGGMYEEKDREIQGVRCNAMVCTSCEDIVFTVEQSKGYHKSRRSQHELSDIKIPEDQTFARA